MVLAASTLDGHHRVIEKAEVTKNASRGKMGQKWQRNKALTKYKQWDEIERFEVPTPHAIGEETVYMVR